MAYYGWVYKLKNDVEIAEFNEAKIRCITPYDRDPVIMGRDCVASPVADDEQFAFAVLCGVTVITCPDDVGYLIGTKSCADRYIKYSDQLVRYSGTKGLLPAIYEAMKSLTLDTHLDFITVPARLKRIPVARMAHRIAGEVPILRNWSVPSTPEKEVTLRYDEPDGYRILGILGRECVNPHLLRGRVRP